MNKGYFIIGIHTGCGKTYIGAGLARTLQQQGCVVQVRKPIISGFPADANTIAESDSGVLLAASGQETSATAIAQISPWRYAAALGPDLAAAQMGETLDLARIVAYCQAEINRYPGPWLIESFGGVMSPLNAHHTVRDWALALAGMGIAPLLICRDYLGSVSHTLSAVAALAAIGVQPKAIVLNEDGAGIGLRAMQTTLTPHLGDIPLWPLPAHANAAHWQELTCQLGLR